MPGDTDAWDGISYVWRHNIYMLDARNGSPDSMDEDFNNARTLAAQYVI